MKVLFKILMYQKYIFIRLYGSEKENSTFEKKIKTH